MNLRILYVAYPLLAISETSCGGAEQVLLTLEREMSNRGHSTVVAATAGSQVTGLLYPTGKARDGGAFHQRRAEHHQAILRLLADGEPFDLVHDMSATFWPCASQLRLPLIATLHLPPVLYPAGMFDGLPSNLYFNCVSASQALSFSLPRMLGVVENGIDLSRFDLPSRAVPREFLLWMGRICEEKAPHIALDVAAQAGLPVALAGQVYPFPYHRQYFEREMQTRLRAYPRARMVETPSFAEKIALLDQARALLITSQIDETSSLVAMEAMARGTPVIAFRRGALGEVIEHRVTGFLVDTAREMVDALGQAEQISPESCRARVRRRYTSTRMADEYSALYERVLASRVLKQEVA